MQRLGYITGFALRDHEIGVGIPNSFTGERLDRSPFWVEGSDDFVDLLASRFALEEEQHRSMSATLTRREIFFYIVRDELNSKSLAIVRSASRSYGRRVLFGEVSARRKYLAGNELQIKPGEQA